MQAMNSLSTTDAKNTRSDLDLCDHPVFQALPASVQSRAEAHSALVTIHAGEPVVEDGYLSFVLAGVLGLFPDGGRICVAMIVSGSVYGWDQALLPAEGRPAAKAVVDTILCRVPANCIVEGLGRDWLTRLVALQSSSRISGLAAEAACNASHLVVERLAKWLVRLHCGANGAPLHLTQADLGAMLGVQRTSINAAAGRLQEKGLVRFGRGKVQILDLAGLRAASCGCGQAAPRQTEPRVAATQRPSEPRSWSSRDATRQASAA